MSIIEGGSLTSVEGIKVGHWSDPSGATGCTVITLPEPNIVTGDTLGAAPGSRETALLTPGMSVESAEAFVLTGGSAFGLAVADGVMAELEADGRGVSTPAGPVPIVPAAAIFDLPVVDSTIRPDAECGRIAYRAASADPVGSGRFGAGTAATISKWRGSPNPGALGSAAVKWGDVTVGALVVLNAVGDAYSLEGVSLSGGDVVPGPMAIPPPVGQNTTLVALATNATLSRSELTRLCVRAHDALGACLRPAHTAFDGDTCFAVSTQAVSASPESLPFNVAEAAFEAVGRAIEAGARSVW
ncbi:MAG: P1 family peptidase [Acidimicrobiales bacterium]|nr:P1 family peptidase [Acidimicrobiales bacterium]